MLARAYGSLSPGARDRAVETLASGDYEVGGMTDWCAANTDDAGDLYLVAGDAWVVVVLGRDDAGTAADRLGGDVRPEPLPTLPPRESEPFQCLP